MDLQRNCVNDETKKGEILELKGLKLLILYLYFQFATNDPPIGDFKPFNMIQNFRRLKLGGPHHRW